MTLSESDKEYVQSHDSLTSDEIAQVLQKEVAAVEHYREQLLLQSRDVRGLSGTPHRREPRSS